MKNYTSSTRGVAAYAVVLGFVGVLLILIGMLSSTSISGRFMSHRYSNDEKANQLAEAATNLVFRMVAEEMNDPKVMFEFLKFKFKKENINSWFWKFRWPMPYLGVSLDKTGSINGEETADGELGAELSINLGKWFNADDMTYTDVQLVDLEPLIAELGGTASITSTAQIAKSYGILPKTVEYKVPGITVDTSKVAKGPRDWLCNFVSSLGSDDVDFKIDFKNDILGAIPEELNLGTLIGEIVEKLKINYAVSAGIAIPIPFGEIVKPILENLINNMAGDTLSLRGAVGSALDEMGIELSFDFSGYRNKLNDLVRDMLPEYFFELIADFEGGYSIEKIGIFEVRTVVDYRPRGITGPTIRRVLRGQREFRVADIQPIAPDYSFFLANSPLLFEDASKENKTGWKGGDKIDWAAGEGAFVVHNLTLFDKTIVERLKTFLTALKNWNTEELNNSLYLPGLVRINGTATQEIPLNFGLLNPGQILERLKHCEIVALLVCKKNKHYDLKAKKYPANIGLEDTDWSWIYETHEIKPAFGESLYGTGFEAFPPLSCLKPLAPVPHFDWPWVTNGGMWFLSTERYNSTHLFGDFHVEFPMKLRVEGNVWKKFSRLKLSMYRIYLPLTAICGFDVDITVPFFPTNEVIVEPYGFCDYPPLENDEEKTDVEGMASEWNHDDVKNLPDNVYSPTQYLKKASYVYRTGAEFIDDIENRVTYVNVGGEAKKVFVCDGVSYIEGNVTLPEMNVTGRGIIVAGGNISIGGSITRIDRPDAPLTLFSLVSRNGAIMNSGDNTVEACLYGDRGLMNAPGNRLRIYGNLVVNQFNRSECQGNIDVHYESNRCHSSFISYFKKTAKFDITRYQVNLSKKWRMFQYEKGE